MLTAKQAANQVGLTKAGILKSIKTGRLSATKGSNGEWLIDPSELLRVYQSTPTELPKSAPAHPDTLAELTVKLTVERERRAVLEQEREREREQLERQIADLRHRLDDEAAERRRLTALLTNLRAPQTQPVPQATRGRWMRRRSWWPWSRR